MLGEDVEVLVASRATLFPPSTDLGMEREYQENSAVVIETRA